MEISLYSMKLMWENISRCPYFGKVLLRLYINSTFCNTSSTVLGGWGSFLYFSSDFFKSFEDCHVSSPVFSIPNSNNNSISFSQVAFATLWILPFLRHSNLPNLSLHFLKFMSKNNKKTPTEALFTRSGAEGLFPISEYTHSFTSQNEACLPVSTIEKQH